MCWPLLLAISATPRCKGSHNSVAVVRGMTATVGGALWQADTTNEAAITRTTVRESDRFMRLPKSIPRSQTGRCRPAGPILNDRCESRCSAVIPYDGVHLSQI